MAKQEVSKFYFVCATAVQSQLLSFAEFFIFQAPVSLNIVIHKTNSGLNPDSNRHFWFCNCHHLRYLNLFRTTIRPAIIISKILLLSGLMEILLLNPYKLFLPHIKNAQIQKKLLILFYPNKQHKRLISWCTQNKAF